MSTISDFERLCRKRLKFLESVYGFTIVEVEECRYGVFITYQNSTSFARISNEPREVGVSVLIGRTVGGLVPPYPIDVKPKTVLNWFNFNDLLALMGQREIILPWTTKYGLSREHLDMTLKKIAHALKRYAIDVFRGDFTIFKQLDRVVKKRAREFESEK